MEREDVRGARMATRYRRGASRRTCIGNGLVTVVTLTAGRKYILDKKKKRSATLG
jgi:hypothetical protein